MLFIIGSTLFALGAVPYYSEAAGLRATSLTFFTGSVFFTSAAFLQYRESVDGVPAVDNPQDRRFWVWAPGNVGWLACAVQFAGTLWFNWSTGNAVRVEPRRRRRGPASVATRRVGLDRLPRRQRARLDGRPSATSSMGSRKPRLWWIAVANLLGSVAFGVSAVAGYVVPTSDDVWNAEVSNLGTLVGAICFLIGAILLLPPRTVGSEQATPSYQD